MARKRVVRYWDRQAGSYDRNTAAVERRFLADSRGWVCRRARGAVLEVAVGTGANLPHYPAGLALAGVDASAGMLQQAQLRSGELARPMKLRQADASALPFPAGSFDTVVCTFALCSIADEHAALTEMLRVLRPGGDLLLADHVAASFWPLRILQHAVDLCTVPLQGEHYTRRPLKTVQSLAVDVLEVQRLHMGAIERVHARRRQTPMRR